MRYFVRERRTEAQFPVRMDCVSGISRDMRETDAEQQHSRKQSLSNS